MSRIGKNPIHLKEGHKVAISAQKVAVSGPKGSLSHFLPESIKAELKDLQLVISRSNDSRRSKALHGLSRSLVANMVTGVETGFMKVLQIQGVGYRCQVKGKKLVLNVGYSHPVEFDIPEGISISVAENIKITIEGIDKQLVGQTAATIRGFKKPEPYKGKGIRYIDEVIQMKEGKTV